MQHFLSLLIPSFLTFLALTVPALGLPTQTQENVTTSVAQLPHPNLAVFLNVDNAFVLSSAMATAIRTQYHAGTRPVPSIARPAHAHDFNASNLSAFPDKHLSHRRSFHPFPVSEDPWSAYARVEYCHDRHCQHCSMFNGAVGSDMCLSAPHTRCIVVEDLERVHLHYWSKSGCRGDVTAYYGCGPDHQELSAKHTDSISVHTGCGLRDW